VRTGQPDSKRDDVSRTVGSTGRTFSDKKRKVSIAKNSNAVPFLISNREVGSVDLKAFDKFVGLMKEYRRPNNEPKFNTDFWSFVRLALEPGVTPVGIQQSE